MQFDYAPVIREAQFADSRLPKFKSMYYDMLNRCHNSNDPNYHHYGGRGIEVCSAWRISWKECFEYLSTLPIPDVNERLTIDRINNDLGYQPGNIRWATRKEQANNRRKVTQRTNKRADENEYRIAKIRAKLNLNF